jgi:uncharacterized protein (DUF1501 family)
MKQNRREFLIKSGCALSMTALATQIDHFGLISALAGTPEAAPGVKAAGDDYRALVCIFLVGGNDGNNTVIPLHTDANLSNFELYTALREPQGLAFPPDVPLPFAVPRMNNLVYGFHPALGVGNTNNGLYELWTEDKLAVAVNIGTLVKPTVKSQIYDISHPKPYNMYSHSDQAAQHQTGRSDRQIVTGWGGRISDRRSSADNPNSLVPMVTSLAGAQFFTAGSDTVPLALAPAPIGLNEILNPQGYDQTTDSQAQLAALHALRTQDLDSEVIRAASHITDQAITVNESLQTYQEITVSFPGTDIGNQLKQVARLIKKRKDLNVRRQIFFCQINGFDTHNIQVPNQSRLLAEMSQAMRAFYDEMNVQGLGDKVTQFTLSDFSRTMNPAGIGTGVGSDHAWGNHHLIVGGGVTGADFFGLNTSNGTPYPTLTLDGPDDADNNPGARGRWIPTASVEQYAATLARWFGLPEENMVDVFPNINNFPTTDLGFMKNS